jgi:hypothetical protein
VRTPLLNDTRLDGWLYHQHKDGWARSRCVTHSPLLNRGVVSELGRIDFGKCGYHRRDLATSARNSLGMLKRLILRNFKHVAVGGLCQFVDGRSKELPMVSLGTWGCHIESLNSRYMHMRVEYKQVLPPFRLFVHVQETLTRNTI